jgi:hypothetical protein
LNVALDILSLGCVVKSYLNEPSPQPLKILIAQVGRNEFRNLDRD